MGKEGGHVLLTPAKIFTMCQKLSLQRMQATGTLSRPRVAQSSWCTRCLAPQPPRYHSTKKSQKLTAPDKASHAGRKGPQSSRS